ncbi:MAG: SUMF1/EgtB/PvdO family nonheme iron enzyme [Gammaproteobacteria bacterium]|nr:SUMF1/EgtB/PvdO family nonheme iron enzyme [Gammaproteobacteria bacterium]
MSSPYNALPVDGMIQEFRIVRVLGAGAFGIVYEARNTFLPQTLVIKEFLPSELAHRDRDGQVRPISEDTRELFDWARSRFLQEAKNLWELAQPDRHPNIVRVIRYGEENGTAYMFMDFEQGRPLSKILEEQGRLTAEQLTAILEPLLDGLERVHAKGILHRDIKPENILIRDDFSPVLIDFGAARNLSGQRERSVVAAYTPIFAALEQQQAVSEQGPWTDIYSLGATLYLAVTGSQPRSAPERLYGLTQKSAVEAARGDFPERILAAIDKGCGLRAEDRPRSVAAWRGLFGTAADATVIARHGRADAGRGASAVESRRPPTTPSKPTGAQCEHSAGLPDTPQRPGHGSAAWVIALALLVIVLAAAGWFYRAEIGQVLAAMGWRAQYEKPVPEPQPEERPPEPEPHGMPEEPRQVPGEKPRTEPTPERASEPTPGPAPITEPETTTEPTPTKQPKMLSEPEPEPEPAATEPQPGMESVAEPEPEAAPQRTLVVPGTRFSDALSQGAPGPVMVWLPAGTFTLGSPDTEAGRNPDEDQTEVRIGEPIALGETEVTVGEYRRFVAATGYQTEVAENSTCLRPDDAWQQLVPDFTLRWDRPGYEVSGRSPVACVTWNDALAYTDWLSEATGKPYRLPTEAEWEYAARAGTTTARFWGQNADAGCRLANTAECDDTHRFAAPAGAFPPNPFGLRGILGNLGEWTCSDYDSNYRGGERRCASRPSAAAPRVFRGGSWLDAPALVRAAARDAAPGNLALSNVGFRVLRELDPTSERAGPAAASTEAEAARE